MMNTLPKSLSIAFLAVSIFISGLGIDFVGAQTMDAGAAAARRPLGGLRSYYGASTSGLAGSLLKMDSQVIK